MAHPQSRAILGRARCSIVTDRQIRVADRASPVGKRPYCTTNTTPAQTIAPRSPTTLVVASPEGGARPQRMRGKATPCPLPRGIVQCPGVPAQQARRFSRRQVRCGRPPRQARDKSPRFAKLGTSPDATLGTGSPPLVEACSEPGVGACSEPGVGGGHGPGTGLGRRHVLMSRRAWAVGIAVLATTRRGSASSCGKRFGSAGLHRRRPRRRAPAEGALAGCSTPPRRRRADSP